MDVILHLKITNSFNDTKQLKMGLQLLHILRNHSQFTDLSGAIGYAVPQ